MSHRVQGIAFVTGAASGIGASTCLKLAENGCTALALVDINVTGLETVASDLRQRFPELNTLVVGANTSDESTIANAVTRTVEAFGRIDIAIGSAGIAGTLKASAEGTVAEWKAAIEVNQIGVWLCEREIVKQMLKQESLGPRHGRGVIVNVSSVLGVTTPKGGLHAPGYVTSKHAVVGFTKMDAKSYAPHEIRINAICPGWTPTAMTQAGIDVGLFAPEIEATAIKRLAEVDEITDAILFLASPMSSYMYGAALVVDGGYSI